MNVASFVEPKGAFNQAMMGVALKRAYYKILAVAKIGRVTTWTLGD